MRLFKSNKPQAILNNLSAGKSPLHSPIESPLPSPALPPPPSAAHGPGGGGQHNESGDPWDEPQPHPGHFPSRAPNKNIVPSAYSGAPVVKVIPDQIDENGPPQLTTLDTNNQEEHRHKKQQRRGIFGRRLSTRKRAQGEEHQEAPLLQSATAPAQYSGQGYSGDINQGTTSSNEKLLSHTDPEPDEQYYRQPISVDSPQSQSSSHYSAYNPDEELPNSSHQNSHRPYQSRPLNSSNSYIPYHPQPDQQSLDTRDPYQSIRPPSQQSFGPPSPVISLQQSNEQRPVAQSRPSNQSGPPAHLQPQSVMARGEAHSNSMRQQMALQQQGSDQGHGQYGMSQGSRQLQQQPSNLTEHGRNTPPPRNRDDYNHADYAALLSKLEELQAKYSKVKKYYFEKDAQVTALQNTVANQRLSMSKTTLDDHEYTTRFNRLDGAISNLSYNIRKDWKGIPPWLAAMVNRDAHTVGTKEMTAVGRACITRWVVDEILDRYFHPRLEPSLSGQLKIIEKNIRRAGQVQLTSEEQREDLIVKLTTWRLTTLEGMADSMATEQGNEYKEQLTTNLVEKLTASLQMNLNDPPPPGLDSGVGMIIELAIGLASSLPLESRDVCVEYYMPSSIINETYMKVESGIPPLTNPGMNADFPGPPDQQQQQQGAYQTSTHSGDSNSDNEADKDGVPPRTDSLPPAQAGNNGPQQQQAKKDDGRKKGFLGGLYGGGGGGGGGGSSSSSKKQGAENSGSGPNNNGGPAPPPGSINNSSSGAGGGRMGSAGSTKERESMEKAERDRRIRFAAFVGVEVRGKGKEGGNVLVRAPCFGF